MTYIHSSLGIRKGRNTFSCGFLRCIFPWNNLCFHLTPPLMYSNFKLPLQIMFTTSFDFASTCKVSPETAFNYLKPKTKINVVVLFGIPRKILSKEIINRLSYVKKEWSWSMRHTIYTLKIIKVFIHYCREMV